MVDIPTAPSGFATCNVHNGAQTLLAPGATRQVNHLVRRGEHGGTPGDTLCGLTRFDRDDRPADLPGWTIGGGVSGPTIEQVRCGACWSEAEHFDQGSAT